MGDRERGNVLYGPGALRRVGSLFQLNGFPKGLFRLSDVKQSGDDPVAGEVWILQEKAIQHYFYHIGRTFRYGDEIRFKINNGVITDLHGVALKIGRYWDPIIEIAIVDVGRLCFTCLSNGSFTFSAQAFVGGR